MSLPLSATSDVNAVAPYWPGYTENDGKGIYWQILKDIVDLQK